MAKSIKTRVLIAAFVRMTSKNRINAKNGKEVNLCPVYQQVEVYAGAIYDAIYLYANALNETLAARGSKRDGRAIVKRMLNREFEGKANIEHARRRLNKNTRPLQVQFQSGYRKVSKVTMFRRTLVH